MRFSLGRTYETNSVASLRQKFPQKEKTRETFRKRNRVMYVRRVRQLRKDMQRHRKGKRERQKDTDDMGREKQREKQDVGL